MFCILNTTNCISSVQPNLFFVICFFMKSLAFVLQHRKSLACVPEYLKSLACVLEQLKSCVIIVKNHLGSARGTGLLPDCGRNQDNCLCLFLLSLSFLYPLHLTLNIVSYSEIYHTLNFGLS